MNPFPILLIDDNEHDRDLTERELRRQFPDCEVISVGTKKDLVRALKAKQFQLAITDYQLTWSDGLTVYHQIREQDPTCPVILYTDASGRDTAARALQAGVDDYVVKSADHIPQLMMSVRLARDRRIQHQTALNAQNRLQFLFQTLPIGMMFIGFGGYLIDANPRMIAMLGYPDRDSLLSLGKVNFFENAEVQNDFHRFLREKKNLDLYEARLRRKDGTLLWCQFFAQPVLGEDGKLQYYEATVEDIQARKQADQARIEKEKEIIRVNEGLNAILETAPAAILGVDENGEIGFVWNQAAVSLLGIPREKAFGRNLFELIPELRPYAADIFPAATHPSTIRGIELAYSPLGRDPLHLHLSVSSLGAAGEKTAGRIIVLSDDTARKIAEDAVRLNQNRLELVYDSVSDMLMLLRVEEKDVLRVVKVNQAVVKNTGRSVETLTGRTIQDFLKEPLLSVYSEKILRAFRSGNRIDFVTSTRPPGRPRLSMEVTLTPLADSGGIRRNILIVARDITTRIEKELEIRRTMHSLRESEHRYRTLAEGSHDMIFILNRDQIVEYVNSSAISIIGQPIEQIIGQPMEIFFPSAVAQRQASFFREVLDTGESMYRENPSQIGEREMWIGTWLIPMRDSGGRITSIMGVSRDITERKESEKAIRASEEQYRSVVQTSPDAIFLHDLDANFFFANSQALTLLGYSSPEELRKTYLLDMVHPDERKLAEAHLKTLRQTGFLRNVVHMILRKDGTALPMEINSSVILDSNGRMKGITSFLRDISERRKREQALQASEARFRAIFEKAGIGILLIGLDGQLIEANNAICEILDEPRESLLLRSLNLTIHSDDLSTGRALLEELLQAQRDHYRLELRLLGGNNQPVWCRLTVSAVKDAKNQILFLIGMVEDISKQREAQQASQQTGESLRKYANRLEILHEIDRAILEAQTTEDIAYATLERMHELVPCHRSSLILFDFQAGTATILDPRTNPKNGASQNKISSLQNFQSAIPKIETEGLMAVEDLLQVENPSPAEQLLLTDGFRTYLSVALTSQGNLIGTLNVASEIPGVFTREHAEIASEVADLLSVGIQQARLSGQVSQHALELESISAFNQDLRAAYSRSEIPEVILHHAVRILKCDSAALLVVDPSRENLVVEKAIGFATDPTGKLIPMNDNLAAEIIAIGKPRLLSPLAGEKKAEWTELLQGAKTAAYAPMISRGSLIGALWASRSQPSAPDFGEDGLRLLGSIAEVAGNALHRAVLHDQTERRLRRLSALRAVDMAISASIDLRVTLSVLLDQVTAQLEVDAAAIRELNPHSQLLTFLSGRGIQSQAFTQIPLPLGQGFAGSAALEHRVISVSPLEGQENAYARNLWESDDRFVSYSVAPLLAKGRIKGVLELFRRTPFQPDDEWVEFLEAMATQAAIAIDNAAMFEDVQKTNTDLIAAYDATIEGWSRALELRDRETQGHTLRVTEITIRLGRQMGIPEDELVHVRRGALMHDIGKMAISDAILLKPGMLSPDEMDIMRQHPVFAFDMLFPIPYLRPALDIPYCHHERWDGTGYPRGLPKDQIPLSARVFAVIDVWDALRSDRPYCAAWPEAKVREYLHEQSGKHFDPAIVEAFLKIVDEERQ